MNKDKICTVCGQTSSPRALKCGCGATLQVDQRSLVIKQIYEEPRETYEAYYHRVMRQSREELHKYIITPEMARAMMEEIKEARERGDTSEETKRYLSLKNFLCMFGGRARST